MFFENTISGKFKFFVRKIFFFYIFGKEVSILTLLSNWTAGIFALWFSTTEIEMQQARNTQANATRKAQNKWTGYREGVETNRKTRDVSSK